MDYNKLIKTVSEIFENENIEKNGLSLTYELNAKNHKAMTEQLFYKSNPPSANCVYTDEFEVEFDGILVRFIKKIEE
jgi:hypothetical protein